MWYILLNYRQPCICYVYLFEYLSVLYLVVNLFMSIKHVKTLCRKEQPAFCTT